MKLAKEFDQLLDVIQAILMSFLVKLGPFAVALMPALFSAYAIYFTFKGEAGEGLALAFAIVVGLALETVGIVATHTAVDLYNGMRNQIIDAGKFWLMLLLVPVYVLGVAGAVWFSEGAFTPLVKSLGVASPFLTCIVYIAVALARDLTNIEQAQQVREQYRRETDKAREQYQRETEKTKLDHELQLELQRLKLDHEQEIRRAELAAEIRLERARINAEKEQPKTESANSPQTVADDNGKAAEYNELLKRVRELSAGNSFKADDLQEWLNRQKTATYDLIKFGRDSGQIHQVGYGKYVMNGNGKH